MQHNHSKKKEVQELQKYKPQSVERKKLLALMRNDGNLGDAERG